ncbi:MAG: protein kinase [Polyangiaceae bacterium]
MRATTPETRTAATAASAAANPEPTPSSDRDAARCRRPTRYDDERFVASGGMGDVWLYRDQTLGRDVAVKELKPNHAAVERRRLRFVREARLQAALQHPGIVPIYDFVECDAGGAYFTMQHVQGDTLSEELARQQDKISTRSRRQLLEALSRVCLTLQYAHERGVVHRDVKPENIMLGKYGEVYVLDWGVAKILEPAEDRPSAVRVAKDKASHLDRVVGTLEYMAPEQFFGGRAVGPTADVFSLGVLLFEILTAQHFREGDEEALFPLAAKGNDMEQRLRKAEVELPPALTALCIQAAHPSPDVRPTAAEFHARLRDYLDGVEESERMRAVAHAHVQSAQLRLNRLSDHPAPRADLQSAAIADLGRAVALDPSREDAAQILRELVDGDAQEPPPEARSTLARQRQAAQRESARASAFSYAAWIALLPLAWWMGVRSAAAVGVLMLGPMLLVLVNVWALRGRRFSKPTALTTLALSFFSVAALSVFAGPYLLVPSLAVATAVTYLVAFRGDRTITLAAQILAPLSVAIPVALAKLGILPQSTVFQEGQARILPFAVDFSVPTTEVLFFVVGTLLVVTANYIVSQVVRSLERSEERAVTQTFWLKRLLPPLSRPDSASSAPPPDAPAPTSSRSNPSS